MFLVSNPLCVLYQVRVIAKCGHHVVPIVDTAGIDGEGDERVARIMKDDTELGMIRVNMQVDTFGMHEDDLPGNFRGSVLRSIELKYTSWSSTDGAEVPLRIRYANGPLTYDYQGFRRFLGGIKSAYALQEYFDLDINNYPDPPATLFLH